MSNQQDMPESRIDVTFLNHLVTAQEGMVERLLKDLSVRFLGSSKVSVGKTITDESQLMERLELLIQASGQVRSPQAPLKYWRTLIEGVVLREKVRQMQSLAASLSHDKGSGHGEVAIDLRLPLLATFTRVLTGRDEPVDLAVMAHFLWQIKRKLVGLPVTYHMMPVIWGKTGAGKSEALKRLLSPIGGYVMTGMSLDKIGDDRYFRQLADHLVIFLDEMPKVEKASVEHIKQVITATELTGRPLYSNAHRVYPQNCTFIGTSNEAPSQLIKDSTGMRRFHYIKCADRMDWETINTLDYVALWREVNERQDRAYVLELKNELEAKQEEVRIREPLEEFIAEGYITATADGSQFMAREAYDAFVRYCEEGGYKFVMTKQSFNKQLFERYGFSRVPRKISRISLLYPMFYGKLCKNGASPLEGKKLSGAEE